MSRKSAGCQAVPCSRRAGLRVVRVAQEQLHGRMLGQPNEYPADVSDGFHPPVEEYLEAIHELKEEGVQVIQARLAERLDHSPPSVSEMVRRLRDDGYVRAQGRALTLTAKGRRRAESVVRKHRLAERLLVDVIGLEWHKIHAEACRWEHVISDDVEARLVELLENPTTCPHDVWNGHPYVPWNRRCWRHILRACRSA